MSSPADLARVAYSADLAGASSVAAGVAPRPTLLRWRPRTDLAEVASSADIAGCVTIGVTCLADPANVVTTGVAFQEKCDVQSGLVCHMMNIFMMDIMTRTQIILTMMMGDYPMCMALLNRMILYHDLHGPDDYGVTAVFADLCSYCWQPGELFRRLLSHRNVPRLCVGILRRKLTQT